MTMSQTNRHWPSTRSIWSSTAFVLLFITAFFKVHAADVSNFTVTAPVDGQTFKATEARGKFIALHFLLKTECPVCLRYTREYAKKSETLTNVVQVFLKPDSADEIRAWATKAAGDDTPTSLRVYRDPEASLAKKLQIPDGYQFHGQVVHYPALVILDPFGKEVFRYVGKNNSDRFGFEAFTVKLNELAQKSPPAK